MTWTLTAFLHSPLRPWTCRAGRRHTQLTLNLWTALGGIWRRSSVFTAYNIHIGLRKEADCTWFVPSLQHTMKEVKAMLSINWIACTIQGPWGRSLNPWNACPHKLPVSDGDSIELDRFVRKRPYCLDNEKISRSILSCSLQNWS